MTSPENSKRLRRGSGRPVHLATVEVRGLRALARVSFAIPAAAPEQGQWIVILGENGAGKTSLLRAIALALGGPSTAIMHLSTLVSTGSLVRTGCQRAEIYVAAKARSTVEHHDVRIERTEGADKCTPDPAYVDFAAELFAYGSGRGSALGGPQRDVDPVRITSTLFDHNAWLVHAETWLRREALRATDGGRHARFFDAVLRTLSSLLPGGETIERKADEFMVRTPAGELLPLGSMSDGYLTTLGWTIDLIARWSARHRHADLDESFAANMPCVVLVDEIDLHLHPRWQLDVVSRLRAAFPKTTFIVTTHNPLTLQGTRPGEVFVLRHDDRTGEISIDQRDVPPGIDANRLLTGDWFGLPSTLAEETLRLLDAHRQMLLAGRPERDERRLALERELRQRLNGFADTSTERMAHGVVAELLDEKLTARQDITAEDRDRVVEEMRRRMGQRDAPTPATPAARPRKPAARARKGAAKRR